MRFARWKSRLATLAWLLKEQGPYKLARIVLARLVDDLWLLGKIIEKSGNSASLDGCVFDLDSPYITTGLKSHFLARTYEIENRQLIQKYLPGDLPFIELGAYIGVTACLTNRMLADPGAHLVVEPNRHILPVLEANKAQNGCQFEILNAAIAYSAGEVTFYLADRYHESNLDEVTRHPITVRATTLQAIMEQEGFDRFNLLCDIEGGEFALVENEAKILRDHVEWLIVEVHDFRQARSARVRATLEAQGFRLVEQYERTLVYYNSFASCNRTTNGQDSPKNELRKFTHQPGE